MEQLVYDITLTNGARAVLKFWESDNPAATENCDACIGYSVYDPDNLTEIDGGEMDYNEAEKNYADLKAALGDIVDFAFDGLAVKSTAPSDIDPDDLE